VAEFLIKAYYLARADIASILAYPGGPSYNGSLKASLAGKLTSYKKLKERLDRFREEELQAKGILVHKREAYQKVYQQANRF
jgi:hypothetical protein